MASRAINISLLRSEESWRLGTGSLVPIPAFLDTGSLVPYPRFVSDLQPDAPHQLQRITLLQHPRPEYIVESHLSTFKMIFKVNVGGA